MEKDDVLKGEGNSYDFGARMLDPRIGRWFAPDPMEYKYPSFSTYSYALNNPLRFNDPNGKDPIDVLKGYMAAMMDYSTMGLTNFRSWINVKPENAKDFNKGLKLADAHVIAQSVMEIGGGGGMAAGGVATMEAGVVSLVVPGAGEVSFVVCEGSGAILAGVGTLIAGHGTLMLNMAKENISEGNYKEEPLEVPLTRKKAISKAKEHAKVPRNSKGGEDVGIDELRPSSRGKKWEKMKENGATKLGRKNPNGKNEYMEHPDGHPDAGQENIPEHHSEGHVHSTDSKGGTMITPYKN